VSLRGFFLAHLEHGLAALLFLARLADVISTRLVTPTLRLEGNPLVRLLGWPFAYATLLVALVAYLPRGGTAVALVGIVLSLLVAAGNLSRLWSVRVQGEELARASAQRLMAAATPGALYGSIFASAALIAAVALLLFAFYPNPDEWAHSFAWGILLYAVANAVYGGLSAYRARAEALAARRGGGQP
jgi:hypothetical protein